MDSICPWFQHEDNLWYTDCEHIEVERGGELFCKHCRGEILYFEFPDALRGKGVVNE